MFRRARLQDLLSILKPRKGFAGGVLLRACLAALALGALGGAAQPPSGAVAAALRFPPLWSVTALPSGQGTWQWEGECRGGLATVLREARRLFAVQGWAPRHETRLSARPQILLGVWRRGDAELLVLFTEQSAARWRFSAGLRKKVENPS